MESVTKVFNEVIEDIKYAPTRCVPVREQIPSRQNQRCPIRSQCAVMKGALSRCAGGLADLGM